MNNIASWIWVLIPIVAIVGGISAGVFKQWIRLKERQLDADQHDERRKGRPICRPH